MLTDYQLSKNELRSEKVSKKEFVNIKRHPIICVLDNLSNLYNIGVIIRLCESFLIEKIYICGRLSIDTKKAKSTALGSEKWIKIIHKETTLEAINEIKTIDYKIVAVEQTKRSIPYNTMDSIENTAFIFGNEKYGISQAVLNNCDDAVNIPMFGMNNSINVSSAASIIIANAMLKI